MSDQTTEPRTVTVELPEPVEAKAFPGAHRSDVIFSAHVRAERMFHREGHPGVHLSGCYPTPDQARLIAAALLAAADWVDSNTAPPTPMEELR